MIRKNKNKARINSKRVKAPHTIVICSSAAFYKQVLEVAKILRENSFKVAVPLTAEKMARSGDFRVETYKTWYADSNTYARKTFLTKHHFNKIVKGDSVLVLNYEKNGKPGYIGGAVLSEMAIALHFKKPIFILNPIQEDVGYKEEILGMLPTILDGKLENLFARCS